LPNFWPRKFSHKKWKIGKGRKQIGKKFKFFNETNLLREKKTPWSVSSESKRDWIMLKRKRRQPGTHFAAINGGI
jgi:hypothetical protein